MTWLLDANIWLELLFDQERADDVRRLLQRISADQTAITEFSIYSVGVILARAKRGAAFRQFVSDVLEGTPTTRVRLETADLKALVAAQDRFGLDFDDAYQYVAAEKHNLTIVSFDSDFDRTPRRRRTPAQALAELAASDATS